MSSLEKCLFMSSAHSELDYLGGVLSCISALYILDTKPLLNMSLANIFSHSVSCLLALLVVSFTMQKLFILM